MFKVVYHLSCLNSRCRAQTRTCSSRRRQPATSGYTVSWLSQPAGRELTIEWNAIYSIQNDFVASYKPISTERTQTTADKTLLESHTLNKQLVALGQIDKSITGMRLNTTAGAEELHAA